LTFSADSKISTLGREAFSSCSALQSIRIPSSVQEIAWYCFMDCRTLANCTFEPGSKISTLAESAFSSCPSLQSICIAGCELSAELIAKLVFLATKTTHTSQ
jgi:hypothetical protein